VNLLEAERRSLIVISFVAIGLTVSTPVPEVKWKRPLTKLLVTYTLKAHLTNNLNTNKDVHEIILLPQKRQSAQTIRHH
jgi:hypothetical protein